MTSRTHTVLLAVIAACAVALVADQLVTPAHAEAPEIRCTTTVFDWNLGKKKGYANLESHRAHMEELLGGERDGGRTHTIYVNSLPIRDALNGKIVAEGVVLCTAS